MHHAFVVSESQLRSGIMLGVWEFVTPTTQHQEAIGNFDDCQKKSGCNAVTKRAENDRDEMPFYLTQSGRQNGHARLHCYVLIALCWIHDTR